MEKHWQRITPVTLLLLPLSAIFAAVSWLRRLAYSTGLIRKQRVAVPVVVVGNLSVGGTGKTPVVIWLAEALRARGYRPGVVSRGYRGSEQLRAIDAQSPPAIAGDEPVLIARRARCPVWVGRDRAAAATQLVSANPQVNVVIADDGLQHYRLRRDCELVVVDAQRRFGNRLLLPAGPLREPVSRLQTVDAVIVNGAAGTGSIETDAVDAADAVPDLPRAGFGMQLIGDRFRNLLDEEVTARPGEFKGKRLHAIAGIGNPERFFTQLSGLGLSFEAHAFADHHAFSEGDLEFVNADAVLMTEKDAIKCARFARKNWWALPVEARIDDALVDLVIRKIGPVIGH